MLQPLAALLCISMARANGPMNTKGTYTIANPPKGTDPSAPAVHRGEFFELLGPAKTGHYGDVNWHTETMQLPADIVARFDGKVMAVSRSPSLSSARLRVPVAFGDEDVCVGARRDTLPATIGR